MSTHSNSNLRNISRRRLLRSATLVGSVGIAGCLGGGESNPADQHQVDDEFVFVTTIREDPDEVAQDYAPLADWIQEKTDVATRIDPVQDPTAAINALATGQAHLSMLSGGPAWVAWRTHDLETIAVEADADGNTHYIAAALVRTDSDIESVADLRGVDSCHTGDLTGAGMLIPTAHLAHEGLVSFDEDDDVSAIRDAVEEFFGEPFVGGGYIGSLQCLSRGHGEVGFMRESTPEDYCGGSNPPDWCLAMDEYRVLERFAQVPSHPVMIGAEVTIAEKALLQYAFLSLNDDPHGREILEEVLGAHQLKPSTSATHLGPYGELIEILPGIEDHLVS